MTDAAAARRMNLDATFCPQDPTNDNTLPYVQIGDVQVFVYVDDTGTLTISTHHDAVVPTLIIVGGTEVWRG